MVVSVISVPISRASAIPAKAICEKASPRKEIFFSVRKTDNCEVAAAERRAPIKACKRKRY